MLEQLKNGLVAQLGAHHIRIVGVVGSNPIRSTTKDFDKYSLCSQIGTAGAGLRALLCFRE